MLNEQVLFILLGAVVFGFRTRPAQRDARTAATARLYCAKPQLFSLTVKPRGSTYLIFEDSGPKKILRLWLLEPETSNIGYLGPLGNVSFIGDLVILVSLA